MAQDDEPDVRVEGWLKTLGIASLCQWDVLVFLNRHPSMLIGAENLPFYLGYATAEIVSALDSLESSGFVEASRVAQGVRLYQVTASVGPAHREALEGLLMTIADRYVVRRFLAPRLRGND